MSAPTWFRQALAHFETWHARVRHVTRRTRNLLALACMGPALGTIALTAFTQLPANGGLGRAIPESLQPLYWLLVWYLAYIGLAVLVGMSNPLGIGTRFYGKASMRHEGRVNEYETIQWVVFFWLPVFPLRSLRIQVPAGPISTLLGDYEFVEIADLPCNHRLALKTLFVGWASGPVIACAPFVALVAVANLLVWLGGGGFRTLSTLQLLAGGTLATLTATFSENGTWTREGTPYCKKRVNIEIRTPARVPCSWKPPQGAPTCRPPCAQPVPVATSRTRVASTPSSRLPCRPTRTST